jgi:hypothetical protein
VILLQEISDANILINYSQLKHHFVPLDLHAARLLLLRHLAHACILQLHFVALLEGRLPQVRTAGAPERVAQVALSAVGLHLARL